MPPAPNSLTTFLLTVSATSANESSPRTRSGTNSAAKAIATGMSSSRLTGVFLGGFIVEGTGGETASGSATHGHERQRAAGLGSFAAPSLAVSPPVRHHVSRSLRLRGPQREVRV